MDDEKEKYSSHEQYLKIFKRWEGPEGTVWNDCKNVADQTKRERREFLEGKDRQETFLLNKVDFLNFPGLCFNHKYKWITSQSDFDEQLPQKVKSVLKDCDLMYIEHEGQTAILSFKGDARAETWGELIKDSLKLYKFFNRKLEKLGLDELEDGILFFKKTGNKLVLIV